MGEENRGHTGFRDWLKDCEASGEDRQKGKKSGTHHISKNHDIRGAGERRGKAANRRREQPGSDWPIEEKAQKKK